MIERVKSLISVALAPHYGWALAFAVVTGIFIGFHTMVDYNQPDRFQWETVLAGVLGLAGGSIALMAVRQQIAEQRKSAEAERKRDLLIKFDSAQKSINRLTNFFYNTGKNVVFDDYSRDELNALNEDCSLIINAVISCPAPDNGIVYSAIAIKKRIDKKWRSPNVDQARAEILALARIGYFKAVEASKTLDYLFYSIDGITDECIAFDGWEQTTPPFAELTSHQATSPNLPD